MNNTQLECFVKVAEMLSFQKASEELNLTQPTVSKQIRSLENELNIRLLNRSTRRVELTAAGQRFLSDARNILSDMNHARTNMASFANSSYYAIRIGYTEVTELPFISRSFHLLRRDYPNVAPFLRLGSTGDNLTRLVQGGLDMAFGLKDIAYDEVNLLFEPLYRTKLSVIVPRGHPLYHRSSVESSELKRFSQVLYIPEQRRSQYYMQSVTDADVHTYITSSVAETYALVTAGMGYAVIPSCYKSQDDSIHAIPVSDAEEVDYGIFMHKGMVFSALQIFTDYLKEECQ